MATHVHATPLPDLVERRRLGRRAQLLAAASVSYNVIEATIAISAGIVAGSVALVGFGLDSVVEVSSGLIILWQFRHRLPESRERQALRLMAFSFFALAGYVTVESTRALVQGHEPDASPVGIGLAVASLLVMPFLSWAQRRTGHALGSNAVVADSTQTLLCTYLSAVLLVGLVLNATLGWSWADPIAGLVIAAVAVKEGRDAWRGDGCCGPLSALDEIGGCARASDGCEDDRRPPTAVTFVDLGRPERRAAEPEQGWVPEACSLPVVEQPLRIAEFDSLFAERLLGVRRIEETGAELVLRDGPGVAERVRELADRETACCSFFRFVLKPEGSDLVLRIGVPATQTQVLSALVDRAEAIGAAR